MIYYCWIIKKEKKTLSLEKGYCDVLLIIFKSIAFVKMKVVYTIFEEKMKKYDSSKWNEEHDYSTWNILNEHIYSITLEARYYSTKLSIWICR